MIEKRECNIFINKKIDILSLSCLYQNDISIASIKYNNKISELCRNKKKLGRRRLKTFEYNM